MAGENAEVMVATHNQGSIEATVALMGRLALDPSKGVYFGQLLGMADHLTFTLGRNGYNVRFLHRLSHYTGSLNVYMAAWWTT